MRRTLIFLVCLLALSVAYAVPFDVKYAPVKDAIYANDTAQYLITIDTGYEYSGKFQFYTISASWDITPTFLLYNGSKQEFLMEIVPYDDSLTGPNLVPVTFKSLDENRIKVENIFIYLKEYNETPKEYVPNVLMTVTTDSEIDPRLPVTLNILMNNRNPLNFGDVRIIVESKLFSKEFRTTLGPLDNKENSVLFGDLDPLLEPGIYSINVQLIDSLNRTVAESTKQVLVKSYSDVSIEQTREKALFRSKEVILLKNSGNAYATKSVQTKKNFFERVFTTATEEYQITNDNGVPYIVWNVQLEPEEARTITIVTNYTILVIIILLIILGIISYYIFRSPLLLFKRARIVTASEHGVSEVKVRLHIKNRSGKTIRNIKIIDKYPKIVQLEEESALGMLKPSRMISADKTHSLLMWNLDVLDPYEERLLTYKLKSQLNIVGNMRLPSGKVKFLTPAGERTYYSNDVMLLHKSEYHLNKKN